MRSGFDLLLRTLAPRPGDEVLFTEVTIPGMVQIAERAGYVPRGAPVDRETLAADPAAIEARLTPKTRVVVVASLFGSRNPLAPIAEVARRHGALVVEDAAQAFSGRVFAGSPEADVTMFSFGMIKRSTAAGGAVLRVHDPDLREAMRQQLDAYPLQTRRDYARRLAVLTMHHLASDHRWYGALYRLLSAFGDPDRLVSKMGKSRPTQQSADRLCRRPGAPLLRMMARRVQQGTNLPPLVPAESHRELGANACGSKAAVAPGWVLPATFEQPGHVVATLRRLGYDASTLSSLVRVGDEAVIDHWLGKTLFLPTDPNMPPAERERMIKAALTADRDGVTQQNR